MVKSLRGQFENPRLCEWDLSCLRCVFELTWTSTPFQSEVCAGPELLVNYWSRFLSSSLNVQRRKLWSFLSLQSFHGIDLPHPLSLSESETEASLPQADRQRTDA